MILPKQHTIHSRGKLISLEKPIVMGILNMTPDSFYASSRVSQSESAVTQVGQMLAEGAEIIDVGAASSRPGSDIISVKEESERLFPVLELLIRTYPEAVFSIDTWRAEISRTALEMGAHMINDITAGTMEPDIVSHVAQHNAAFIAMHMSGTPGHMPIHPVYEDVAGEILLFFVSRIRHLRDAGINDIILDPGFGFGKRIAHNFELLRKLEVFHFLELPLLVGISRKGMIWRTLDITPEEALNGTTALHMLALQKGANVLRVHDVRAAKEVIALYQALCEESLTES